MLDVAPDKDERLVSESDKQKPPPDNYIESPEFAERQHIIDQTSGQIATETSGINDFKKRCAALGQSQESTRAKIERLKAKIDATKESR